MQYQRKCTVVLLHDARLEIAQSNGGNNIDAALELEPVAKTKNYKRKTKDKELEYKRIRV